MAIFGVGTCVIFSHACRLGSKLSIDEGDVVGGDVRVRGGGQVVDLTTIQPETCSDYQPPVIPGAATAPSAQPAQPRSARAARFTRNARNARVIRKSRGAGIAYITRNVERSGRRA